MTVDVDGTTRVYTYSRQMSVRRFLQDIGVTLNELTGQPPLFAQLTGGCITISRVVERLACEEQVIPQTRLSSRRTSYRRASGR